MRPLPSLTNAIALVSLLLASMFANADDKGEAIKAMEDYLAFVDYGGATIFPEQIPAEDWKRFHVIDARDKAQYDKEHIPGAINIEWRRVLEKRASIPHGQIRADLLQYGVTLGPSGFRPARGRLRERPHPAGRLCRVESQGRIRRIIPTGQWAATLSCRYPRNR